MKILCEYEYCGPSFVTEGWRKVLQAMGHQFRYWIPAQQPTFDAFSEFEPDLFIGKTFTCDRAVYKNIVARPDMKTIMYSSAWGDLINEIPSDYPIIRASDKEKGTLEKLKQETGKPDFVFLHYHDNWIDRTLGGWRSIGITPVSMLNAADTFDYYPGVSRDCFRSDLAFVGGYWPYKSKNLDKFLVPLCYQSNYKIKIFGNQPWPVPQYLGYVDNPDVRDIFASTTICPNISEPHSTDFGFDIVERPFKVLACGAFCVSDYVQSAVEDVFGDTLPSAKTAIEFKEMIDYYLDKGFIESTIISEKGRSLVLRSHTYFDRIHSLFGHLGMPREQTRALEVKRKYVPESSLS